MIAELLKPETFEFFARYVLAGFLIILTANAFLAGRKPRPAEAALEIILYSLLNQLCWFALSSLAGGLASWLGRGDLGLPVELGFYLQVLGLPVVIGGLIGLGTRRQWLRPALRGLSLPIVDPYPRAYDHVFAEFVGQALVIVAYHDGRNIYGLFGYRSRAGRDPNRGELFLERLYDGDEQGRWTPSQPPKSALVSLEGMRAIEIIPVPDDAEVLHGTQADR